MNIIYKLQGRSPLLSYFLVSLIASVDALISVIFVYPNDFAPAGIHGFTTMIQHLIGFSAGYSFLLVNIPMLILAFIILSRSYSIKNFLYVIFFSGMCLVFQRLIASFELGFWEYKAQTAEQLILVAIGIGAFNGIAYTLTVLLGGSTGGTDILAALINHKIPSFNTVWILFTINASVAVSSYFVYGRQYLPVVVSILCAFVSGSISDRVLKGASSALKFEVITSEPELLAEEIMQNIKHGCTRLDACGMYENKRLAVLICVINPRQRADFERLIASHGNTFSYCVPVKCTYGRFDTIK